jgi:hypothetical protein
MEHVMPTTWKVKFSYLIDDHNRMSNAFDDKWLMIYHSLMRRLIVFRSFKVYHRTAVNLVKISQIADADRGLGAATFL